LLAVFVQVRKDTASVHLYSIGLAFILCLVVEGEWFVLPLLADPAEEDCAGVAEVGAEEVVVVEVEQAGGCP
jgi:hypothetical protein